METTVELRHLKLQDRVQLCSILQLQDSWKTLMARIPKLLYSKTDCECEISSNNPAKYRSEHFRLIEDHAAKTNKSCPEILFDEWGTSGRIRPTLGHLKYLLQKAQLFRAADYVAVNILKQKPPPRPTKGPSAAVVLTPGEGIEMKRFEQILDGIDYPSSAIESINKMNLNNRNLNDKTKEKATIPPKIIISESPDVDEVAAPAFTVPIVKQNEKITTDSDLIKFTQSMVSGSDNNLDSDLIKFSTDSSISDTDVILPQISSLLNNSESANSDSSKTYNSDTNTETTAAVNCPQLSFLLTKSSTKNTASSAFVGNIPNISGLSEASNISSGSNIPAISLLIENPESKTVSTKNSRSCSSPLPNLSLNTLLPHIAYSELEYATNNFEETPLTENGRFLGSGAFGKVYLAVGLLFNKPVAVKKLLLDNYEEVHVDDTVTKQFRNEVEVLSKYKHENLLSLLGYSCDGCTYCLLYEYIPGGALTDRLQKHELIWTERIYIAMGAAKAISYLHTAYGTPLIHRDVKSANILLDYSNKPKLCDFGLIKLSPTANTNTGTTIFGTSAYMAPEAFRGDISIKLDTFSFGVVLLELLTSLPPVDEKRQGVDLFTHVDELCEDDITPLLDVAVGSWVANETNFSADLYEVAKKCLAEKKKRPTMFDVSKELVELVQKSL